MILPEAMAINPSEYVTLVSNDGFEFIVSRESAYVAGTIKRMLDPTSTPRLKTRTQTVTDDLPGGFAEAVNGRCVFENIK